MNVRDMFISASDQAEKSFKSISLTDTMTDKMETAIKDAKESDSFRASIQDHFGNKLSSAGIDDKVESFNTYGFSNDTLNWPLWLALYNDSWVFRRAIDKPAQDEISCGIVIHGEEDYSKIYKAYDKYKSDLIQLISWGELFGGSIAVMMFDTIPDEEMKLPLQKDKIKGARMKLYVTDRWYGVSCIANETVSNMADIDFGKPKNYTVTFADGKSYEVHHDYILRYEHRWAPRLIKNGQLQGWGYAEGSHILNELARDDQLKAAITSLVNKCCLEIIKMAGMRGIFMGTDKQNEEQLQRRLEMVNWGRTYNSLTFLDKDDDYQRSEFNGITGLSDLLKTNMWIVAAALDMPGILFGDMVGGLSADNSTSFKTYSKTILSRCESYVRPVLTKFLKVLFIKYELEGDVDFDFNSLNKEEEANDKMKSIQDYANSLNILTDAGVISKYQYAQAMIEFVNNGNINILFTDEELNKLKYEEEMSILEVYKAAKKPGVMEAQFGAEAGNKFAATGEVPNDLEALSESNTSLNPDNSEPISKEDLGETSNETAGNES